MPSFLPKHPPSFGPFPTVLVTGYVALPSTSELPEAQAMTTLVASVTLAYHVTGTQQALNSMPLVKCERRLPN